MFINEFKKKKRNSLKIISCSRKTKKWIAEQGRTLGKCLFEKEYFENTLRPQIEKRSSWGGLPVDAADYDFVFKNRLDDRLYGSNHVYRLTPDAYDRVVLYVHGGAFIFDLMDVHLTTCDALASELHARIYMPNYTPAPQGNWSGAYELLDAVYEEALNENKPIILMGDSSGGGLVLGFVIELIKKKRTLPSKVVLYSPWLDLTLSRPELVAIGEEDLSLDPYGLGECAKLWAAGLEPEDVRLSPIFYQDWEGFPDTLLFTGTKEILYPEIRELSVKMKQAGVETQLVLGKALFHIFSLYQTLPEGVKSRKLTKEFVLK